MFCSSSIGIHLARGAAAAALLAMAAVMTGLPWPARAIAVVAAFALMRGCPMCWLMGLVETVARGAAGRASIAPRSEA